MLDNRIATFADCYPDISISKNVTVFNSPSAVFINKNTAAFFAIVNLTMLDNQIATFADLYPCNRIPKDVTIFNSPSAVVKNKNTDASFTVVNLTMTDNPLRFAAMNSDTSQRI